MRFLIASSVLALCLATSGCAALSLFGATHHHTHHDNPNTEKRLIELEHRLLRLETGPLEHRPVAPPLPPLGVDVSENPFENSQAANN